MPSESMDILFVKEALFQKCTGYVNTRIATAQQAMQAAQEAANAEGKSSAGDKYETGRAMMQIERDQAAQQLAEALKLKAVLDSLPKKETKIASAGSIVFTSKINVYIAISAGIFQMEGKEFVTISTSAPLAKSLAGLGKGDSFLFKGEKVVIEAVG